jgi:hypothetical protein
MNNPLAALFLWFFSQDAILYFLFVPLMVLAFFVGLMHFVQRR